MRFRVRPRVRAMPERFALSLTARRLSLIKRFGHPPKLVVQGDAGIQLGNALCFLSSNVMFSSVWKTSFPEFLPRCSWPIVNQDWEPCGSGSDNKDKPRH